MSRLKKQSHFAPLLLWTAVWVLFFSALLFASTHIARGDFLDQFYTFGHFQAREMLAGRLPIWSSGSYAGFPFAADTQTAVFYLPRWLTIFLSAPFGFSYYALELEGLLHIWLLGVFTYLLAFDITKSRAGSLLAAIAFGLGGYITSYPLLQLAILETVTWLPLVLLFLRRGIDGHRPVRWLTAAGLLLGFSFLAGHPQSFLHGSYLAAAYYLFLTIRARWQWRWVVGFGVVAGGMALFFAAASILPTLQYVQASTRSDVSYEFVAKGFALLDYLQLFTPGIITLWSPMYVGLPTLAFVLAAWMLRRHANAPLFNSEIAFWTAVSIITFLLSLGDKGILFALIYRVAPGFSLFRQQERIASLFSLSLALLAAMGVALWQRADEETRARTWRRLFWTGTAVFLLSGFLFTAMKTTNWIPIWMQGGVVVAISLIFLHKSSPPEWRWLGLILLLSGDLFLLSRAQLDTLPSSPSIYWQQPDWISAILDDDPGRIDTLGFINANVGELAGVEDVRGISPLRLAALSKFDELGFEQRWQLLNVTHAIAQEPFVESMTAVMPTDDFFPDQPLPTTLYRYEAALSRAWMVYEATIADNDEAAWQTVAQDDFAPATQVVLTGDGGEITAVTPPSSPPTVNIDPQSARELHIQTDSDTVGVLVISQWNYPGWQARVDGERWPIQTADYALQALILPAGAHEIELIYSPWDVKIGVVLSLLTLIIAALVAWRWQPTIPTRPPYLNAEKYAITAYAPSRAVRHWLWGMVLILLLAFGLRLFLLGGQELRGDEAFSYLFARQPAADIIPALIREGDPHTPLHYLLLHGWMNLAGDSEFGMRYLSLLPSLLLVPLLFQLGRVLNGRRLGMMAAFWLAISQSQIWLAQDVRNQYMLTLFWGTLATLILVWKLANPRQKAGSHPLWYWAAYSAAAAIAVYSHYYGIFILAAHGGFLWVGENGRLRRISHWITAGAVAGLLFLPWVIVSLQTTLAAGQFADASSPQLAPYLTQAGIELLMGSDVSGWWPRWLLAAGLFVLWVGARRIFARKPEWAVLLIGWAGGTILMIYLIRFNRATFNSFYVSVAAPAVWLLFSSGLMALWQQRWRGWRGVAISIGGLLLAANAVGLTHYYFNPAYSRSNGYRPIATAVLADSQAGDLFLAQFPDPVWGYYLRDAAIPLTMLPATAITPAEESQQTLQALTEQYDRLWFVPTISPDWDAEDVVGDWLHHHLLRESAVDYNRLKLLAFRPERTVDGVTTAVNATLNQQISLQSAYITINGQPAALDQPLTVTTGDTLSVSLIWETMEPLAENYTVFVHIVAEDGFLLMQHDGLPKFGTFPTPEWGVGQPIIDQHDLDITHEGAVQNGRLIVGMYQTDTLTRLPFADGETALELVSIDIKTK